MTKQDCDDGGIEIYTTKKERNFTQIDNALLYNPQLSLKAKALQSILLSFPHNGWKIRKDYITKLSTDGKDSVNSGFYELENKGYLDVVERRTPDGRFATSYFVYESLDIKPNGGKGHPLRRNRIKQNNPEQLNHDGNSGTAKQTRLSSDDRAASAKPPLPILTSTNTINNKTELTNTDNQSESSVSPLIAKIKELFGGEYQFDRHFERDVTAQLDKYNIKAEYSPAYAEYVYQLASNIPIRKSLMGLYRKLALTDSITLEFKLSGRYFNADNTAHQPIRETESLCCPACGNSFAVTDTYCPYCGLATSDIHSKNTSEISLKSKIYALPDSKKDQLTNELSALFLDASNPRQKATEEDIQAVYRKYIDF